MAAGRAESGERGETPSLSERLLAVLRREMDALEAGDKELRPRSGRGGGTAEAAEAGGPASLGGAKGRIEAVGQMTRTLEKLLELKRLEALEARGDGDEDDEAARLREEMLKRLKALDARRRAGPTLFTADGRFANVARQDEHSDNHADDTEGSPAGAQAATEPA